MEEGGEGRGGEGIDYCTAIILSISLTARGSTIHHAATGGPKGEGITSPAKEGESAKGMYVYNACVYN